MSKDHALKNMMKIRLMFDDLGDDVPKDEMKYYFDMEIVAEIKSIYAKQKEAGFPLPGNNLFYRD